MKTYTISQLAGSFGLSRSTLLYYDRIGLLPPYCRTESGYRCYSEDQYLRLERICEFRQAGLSITAIKDILNAGNNPQVELIEARFHEIGKEMKELRYRQRMLAAMVQGMTCAALQPKLNRGVWVEMLENAGMDEDAMDRWHAEFEKRAPEEHHEFLLSLGIPEDEVLDIRSWALAWTKRR